RRCPRLLYRTSSSPNTIQHPPSTIHDTPYTTHHTPYTIIIIVIRDQRSDLRRCVCQKRLVNQTTAATTANGYDFDYGYGYGYTI
ncbi:hypothetical protein M5D96_006455, partial [Drosophila gunungcola]